MAQLRPDLPDGRGRVRMADRPVGPPETERRFARGNDAQAARRNLQAFVRYRCPVQFGPVGRLTVEDPPAFPVLFQAQMTSRETRRSNGQGAIRVAADDDGHAIQRGCRSRLKATGDDEALSLVVRPVRWIEADNGALEQPTGVNFNGRRERTTTHEDAST